MLGICHGLEDVDKDSMKEAVFRFSGSLFDFEQSNGSSLPTDSSFEHLLYGGGSGGFTGMYIGFLDQDSTTDVLYKGSEPPATIRIYVAEYDSEASNFSRVWSHTYATPYPESGIGGFSVADFDRDGYKEFVLSDITTGRVFVTENTGDNSFTPTWQDSTPFANLYYHGSGDVDRDGKDELFVGANMSNGNWTLVYEAVGDNQYSPTFLFHLLSGGEPIYNTADMDGDGERELVIFAGAVVYIYIQVQSGQ
jgi:hypothetical protein